MKAHSFPAHLRPMLAVLSRQLPREGQDFGYEFKWDGVRAICFWDGSKIRFESRNLIDMTSRYPELLPLKNELGTKKIILDGEIVALDRRPRICDRRLVER